MDDINCNCVNTERRSDSTCDLQVTVNYVLSVYEKATGQNLCQETVWAFRYKLVFGYKWIITRWVEKVKKNVEGDLKSVINWQGTVEKEKSN